MKKVLSAVIVDDERDARDGLEHLLAETVADVKVIAKAENAQNALEIVMDEEPNIIFLDIQMPVNNGFWLANKLSKLQKSPCIIFVTAYDEYAIEAIKHAAFDFLTKPVIPEVLQQTIQRLLESGYNNTKLKLKSLEDFLKRNKLKFPTYEGFELVSVGDIIYCQADGNYSQLMLMNAKKLTISSRLGTLESKLNDYQFVRVNRSIIVNIKLIEKYSRKNKTVFLSDGLQNYEFKVSSKGAKLLAKL